MPIPITFARMLPRPGVVVEHPYGLHHFIPHDHVSHLLPTRALHGYFRPWKFFSLEHEDAGSVVTFDKNKFQVCLDVKQFAPDEINVKIRENEIIIQGKHEEKQDDHGFISREFTRKYIMPKGLDDKAVVANLSSDGILTITAPNIQNTSDNERVIPIAKTGVSHEQQGVKKEEQLEDKKVKEEK